MDKIIKYVNRLIKKHETRNPFRLAGYEGVKVNYYAFDEIKGYYYKMLGRRFIVVNSNLDEQSKMVVCAHELGHAMLHDVADTYFMSEHTLFPTHSLVEREANMFAAELILGGGEFAERFHDNMFCSDDFISGSFSLSEGIYRQLFDLKQKSGGA